MSNALKLLARMRVNEQNWRIDQLECVARWFGVNIRKSGGSHVIFEHGDWNELLSVPARKPIKVIYVKRFILLIDSLEFEE